MDAIIGTLIKRTGKDPDAIEIEHPISREDADLLLTVVKKIKLEKPSLAKIVEALDMAKATAFDPAKLREHARRALYLIEARRAKTPAEVAWAVAIAQGQMKSPGELVVAAEHALQQHDCAVCAELLEAAGAPGLAQLVAMCQPALERAWAEEAEG